MVPVPISARNSHSSRLLYILFSLATQHAPRLFSRPNGESTSSIGSSRTFVKRGSEFNPHDPKSIAFVVLIPILVLSSGLFAGLTLGYMSLDETQLNVLSISGTPEQKKYANKIMPIRKNGHLLLVTLLLANMIVNETLPVISDPILGGGVLSVVVSTILIVIFAEIIPQSLFTRHGLYLGAKMAGFTKFLIYFMGFIAWPVAKLLELVLGPHHGIIYRRGELKELIAMHDTRATHGGDLKTDTVAIIGATLDLQEKVVKQAMTPISDVFMLSIDSKLDYALLKKICETGHSRVPVYEEIDVPVSVIPNIEGAPPIEAFHDKDNKQRTVKVKKIIGIFLVKQCVLLDPKEAIPLRKLPLNKVPFVPNNEPLLGILDKFQEGRTHIAIVSRFSAEKAASVKKAVKRGLTHRLKKRVGMGDSESETESSSADEEKAKTFNPVNKKRSRRRRLIDNLKRRSSDEDSTGEGDGGSTIKGENVDNEKIDSKIGVSQEEADDDSFEKKLEVAGRKNENKKKAGIQIPKLASGMTSMLMLEQNMPADAVLAKSGAAEFLQGFDPAVMPLGIITLEDVLEELIGEEIYDEFDTQGAHGDPYQVPPVVVVPEAETLSAPPVTAHSSDGKSRPSSRGFLSHSHTAQVPIQLKGFFRTRSAPPERNSKLDTSTVKTVRIDDKPQELQVGSGSTTIHMPKPIRSSGNPPSVILEQHSSVSSSESGLNLMPSISPALTPPSIGVDGKSKTLPLPRTSTPAGGVIPIVSPSAISGVGVIPSTPGTNTGVITVPAVQVHRGERSPSRSGSPAPLEAILLDRKRRLAAAHGQATPSPMAGGTGAASLGPETIIISGGGTSAMPISTPGTLGTPSSPSISMGSGSRTTHPSSSGGKGTRFKSSPIGGFDRAGVVVAEQLNAAYGKGGGTAEDQHNDGPSAISWSLGSPTFEASHSSSQA